MVHFWPDQSWLVHCLAIDSTYSIFLIFFLLACTVNNGKAHFWQCGLAHCPTEPFSAAFLFFQHLKPGFVSILKTNRFAHLLLPLFTVLLPAQLKRSFITNGLIWNIWLWLHTFPMSRHSHIRCCSQRGVRRDATISQCWYASWLSWILHYCITIPVHSKYRLSHWYESQEHYELACCWWTPSTDTPTTQFHYLKNIALSWGSTLNYALVLRTAPWKPPLIPIPIQHSFPSFYFVPSMT